jgi:hypothetical protein
VTKGSQTKPIHSRLEYCQDTQESLLTAFLAALLGYKKTPTAALEGQKAPNLLKSFGALPLEAGFEATSGISCIRSSGQLRQLAEKGFQGGRVRSVCSGMVSSLRKRRSTNLATMKMSRRIGFIK